MALPTELQYPKVKVGFEPTTICEVSFIYDTHNLYGGAISRTGISRHEVTLSYGTQFIKAIEQQTIRAFSAWRVFQFHHSPHLSGEAGFKPASSRSYRSISYLRHL